MAGASKNKALTPAERRLLYSNLTDAKEKALFCVMAFAGLRVGEVAQLRASWIETRTIHDKNVLVITIPQEAQDINNANKLWTTKTKKGRSIYIFDSQPITDITTFFSIAQHFNISIRQIRNYTYKWSKYIGMTRMLSPHALRATCQNYWKYEKQLKLEVISYMLGHASLQTTFKYYDTRGKAQVEAYLEATL